MKKITENLRVAHLKKLLQPKCQYTSLISGYLILDTGYFQDTCERWLNTMVCCL